MNYTRGLYFVVNGGGSSDAEITGFNAWFAEDDNRSIDEQHRILDAAPLRPSLRVETRRSVHAYWLIAGECKAKDWRAIQNQLIAHFACDEKIKNPSRVMRLPFFNHVHYEKESNSLSYKRVSLVEFKSELRYTLKEMQAAFSPPNEPSPITLVTESLERERGFSSWEELHTEAKHRISHSPKARINSRGWTHAPGICHGSTNGKAQFISPDGAYGCHNGCTTLQIRAAYGLPVQPDTTLAAIRTQPKAEISSQGRPSPRLIFTTLDDLLAEPKEETAYVWDRTLPRGGFSICAAKPKVGKSTLARNLAVAISQGVEFFGRATIKGKVIYLCLEEKRAEVAAHFRRMGAQGQDILIYTGTTPKDVLEALETAIQEQTPMLVIIDPLSRFVRIADFNSYGEVTRGLEPLIDLARLSECQCHILAVHHNGKGERENGDALLGSTGFFGAVDTLLTMKRREQVRTLQTAQRYGEDIPETVAHLDNETGIVMVGGDLTSLQIGERKEKILEAIGNESLTESDIKEHVGGNQTLTAKAIRGLYETGILQRTGAGKRGDPYYYQKVVISELGGKSSILDSTEIENPENLEYREFNSLSRKAEIHIPAEMTDEEYERQYYENQIKVN